MLGVKGLDFRLGLGLVLGLVSKLGVSFRGLRLGCFARGLGL